MAEPSLVSETSDDVIDDGHSPATRRIARLLAVFILPSIFFILAALATVLFLLPRLKSGHIAAPAPAVATAPVDKDAEINALRGQVAALQGQLLNHSAAPAATPGVAPVYAADSAALAQLSARLDRVEANQRALAHAASAAAAAEALQSAADTGAPFPTELAQAQSSLDNPHLFDAVRPFADRGLPSKATLATQFPHVAATANIAAQAANGDKGPLAKLLRSLGNLMSLSVRRTDAGPRGVGVEATLARAEAHMDTGDLAGAVSDLNSLPPPAQAAIKPWLDKARARVALDNATRQISEAAFGTLGRAGGDVSGGTL
jgi:hypothetical protein